MQTSMYLVVAALAALALGATADVAIGNLTVSDDAALFQQVSEAVCNVFSEMDFEPVDWSAVNAAYEAPADFGVAELSLKDLAKGAVFGDDIPDVWADYQDFFSDPTWLDTNVLEGIEADGESDGARTELVQKSSRDANGVAHVLALIERAESSLEAAEAAEAGGESSDDDVLTALFFVEAAWVIYHGYDNGDGDVGTGCAPYGTGESRSGNFGLGGDVTERIVAAFEKAQSAVQDAESWRGEGGTIAAADEAVMELFEEVQKSTLITYLRAAYRYGARMDGNAADGDPANLRVNQLEGLAFFRTVEPYASSLDSDAAATIDSLFAVSNYAPDADGNIDLSNYEDVGDTILDAVYKILEARRIDIETEFGQLE